jgi:hypothetical protein
MLLDQHTHLCASVAAGDEKQAPMTAYFLSKRVRAVLRSERVRVHGPQEHKILAVGGASGGSPPQTNADDLKASTYTEHATCSQCACARSAHTRPAPWRGHSTQFAANPRGARIGTHHSTSPSVDKKPREAAPGK